MNDHSHSPANLRAFDEEDLLDRVMGNEDLARRVAGAFIETMPAQLAALAQAIESSDSEATVLVAHTIKGAAANVGGAAVRDLAAKLNRLGETGAFASAAKVMPELEAEFEALRPELQRFCGSKR